MVDDNEDENNLPYIMHDLYKLLERTKEHLLLADLKSAYAVINHIVEDVLNNFTCGDSFEYMMAQFPFMELDTSILTTEDDLQYLSVV